MSFHQYDPGLIFMSFRGVTAAGYMDGTFINVERTEDAWEMAAGAGGDITRVRNRNRSGTVTVTIKAESPTNDLWSVIAAEDELFGTGLGALMIKDILGNTVIEAPVAWIKKLPVVEYADGATGREWMFDCHELTMFVGGQLSPL